MANSGELDRCFEVALELARSAGKVAYDAVHGEMSILTKETSCDLVTETDKKVEELIMSTLRQNFPSHQFIGEESTAESGQKNPLTDQPTWMVDPIDGTSNFVHGFPFSAVSIGLAVNKEAVMGVVYNFNLDQMFAAKKGGGATMNGKPIKVSKCTELNKALVFLELGARRDEEVISKKIDSIYKMGREPKPVQAIRSIGSAALNMCMTAMGSGDGYFEYGVHCWDIAAGDIIVREAGGVTMGPTGSLSQFFGQLAMATPEELNRCLEVALDVARSAGKVAYDAVHREMSILTKETSCDLVTETDKKVEELIMSTLRQNFPSHQFIGEESTAESGQKNPLTDQPTWMVDPIDGTSNFVHGFPFSAVSIGLAVNKEAVMGVVYNFNLDQMFAAKKGGGATMNGKPIKVSKCTELNKAMIMIALGPKRKEEVISKKIDSLYKMGREPDPVLGFRYLGSAALSMCMTAMGSADGYSEYGIHCWDIAAGDIIVREAGGVTMGPTGEPLDLMRRGILCASSKDLALKLVSFAHNLEEYYEPD